MSDETSKKIQVPLLVTSDSLDYPIIGYNVIDEFVTQQSDCNDPMIQSFKNTQPENVHALINFIQTPKQTDLCDVKTSKRDVTIPKKQSMKISCRVNTGPLEQKVPVLFEPSELEQWPAGLEVPEMLLSLKQGNKSIVHVKVFNSTDHDIVLHNRTEIGRLQLVRSVYPIEVKPADSNEADSQDQEEDFTSGEPRKSEEVEELNKKGANEQDCLGKCDLKDGVIEKGLEQNGTEWCSHYDDFRYHHKCLVDRLLSQGYKALRLEKSFKKFYGRYQDLIEKYRRSINAMVSDSFPGQFLFNM